MAIIRKKNPNADVGPDGSVRANNKEEFFETNKELIKNIQGMVQVEKKPLVRTIYLDFQIDAQLNGRAKAEGISKQELIVKYIQEGLAQPSSRVSDGGLHLDLIEALQDMGRTNGTEIADMIERIRYDLNHVAPERFPVIVYLSRAFNIPVADMKEIGRWVGFAPAGEVNILSDDELQEKFYPYILKWAALEHGFS